MVLGTYSRGTLADSKKSKHYSISDTGSKNYHALAILPFS